jgi:hypothetical protein
MKLFEANDKALQLRSRRLIGWLMIERSTRRTNSAVDI